MPSVIAPLRATAAIRWSASIRSASRLQIRWGNGATSVRSYDQNYWIDSINSSQPTGLDLDFTLDPVGNISGISDVIGAVTPSNTYTYDALDRLRDIDTPSSNVETYTYDAVGNRTSKAIGAAGPTPYTYGVSAHRLESVAGVLRNYDANGNTTRRDAAQRFFQYDERNRFSAINEPRIGTTAIYKHNARGERVLKNIGTFGKSTRAFAYDESGRLLAELDNNIATQQDYLWLDDLPIGLLEGGILHHIQPDHLGSPRKVIQASSNAAIWHWPILNNPFGETAPNEDPDGNAIPVILNLRFPGQYFDAETGLHYNYFRDYEPGTGRYVESDPIGLGGGITTYAYTEDNPLQFTDPFGMSKFDKLYGLSKKFWNWYHRKVKRKGDPDIDKEEAEALNKEWEKMGKPGPDSKGKQDGFVDPELLLWLIPWPITPSDIGCAEIDCDKNGIPDYEERDRCPK